MSDRDDSNAKNIDQRVLGNENFVAGRDINVQLNAEQTIQISKKIAESFYSQGGQTDLQKVIYTHRRLILEVPPLVKHITPRSNAVTDIQTQLKNHAWVALNGDCGCGKSQLAILVAKQMSHAISWLRLRDISDHREAGLMLDMAIDSLKKSDNIDFRQYRYVDLLQEHKTGSIFIIDDLPPLDGEDDLSLRLVCLVQAFAQKKLHLLSTSNFRLPQKMYDQLGDSLISLTVPKFTKEEIRELLIAYGAPMDRINQGQFDFISIITKGNATLLTAVARFLAEKQWSLQRDEFDNLITGKYANILQGDIVKRLVGTVDDEGRELLYRLKLVMGSFTTEDVQTVASVRDVIQRPDEKIVHLTGLWIQDEGKGRYTISPLIRSLGFTGLIPEVERDVHLALAHKSFNKEGKNQWDAQTSVFYFLAAKEYYQGALILLSALQPMLEIKDQEFDDACLGLIWMTQEIPQIVPLQLRISLRGYQIAVNQKLGRDVNFLISDLAKLAEEINPEHAFFLMGAFGMIITQFDIRSMDWSKIYRIAGRVFELYPEMNMPERFDFTFPEGFCFENTALIPIASISTTEDLLEWMGFLERLPKIVLERAFEGYQGEDACIQFSNLLWPSEFEKPERDRDWKSLISVFEEFADRAKKIGLNLLWACAHRARIIIAADYLDDLERSNSIAAKVLDAEKDDLRVIFVIMGCMGSQYCYKKRYKDALPWLEQAISIDGIRVYPIGRLTNLNQLSCALGELGETEKGVKTAKNAVKYAESSMEFIQVDIARTYGELGIAKWLANDDAPEIFGSFENALRLLVECEDDSEFWKATVASLGHTIGYLMALSKNGKPPDENSIGEPYAKPFRGMLYAPNYTERSTWFKIEKLSFLMAQMSFWADAIGNDNSSVDWAKQARVESKKHKTEFLAASLNDILISDCIVNDELGNAMELAKEAGIALAATRVRRTNNISVDQPIESIKDLLGPNGSEHWLQAEYSASVMGYLPAMLRILLVALSDHTKAKILGEKLSGYCRDFGTNSNNPNFWMEAEKLLDQILDESFPAKDFKEKVSEYNDNFRVLHAVCCVGISIKKDIPLDRIIRFQIAVIPWIWEQTSYSRSIQRKILIPFFEQYWRHKFEEQRFRFNQPVLLEDDFAKISDIPWQERLKFVMRIVSRGLGIKLKDNEKIWLYGEKSG